jgi:transcriptional regulator with XRE-family HTH domain
MSEDTVYFYGNSDASFLAKIGHYVKTIRMRKNMTQNRLAKTANISRSTLSLLENGEGCTLQTLIQVLRMLDSLHVFEVFHIEDRISPVAYAKLVKKQRQRASKENILTVDEPPLEW